MFKALRNLFGRQSDETVQDVRSVSGEEIQEVMRTYMEVQKDEGATGRPADYAATLRYMEPSANFPPQWPGTPLCGCCSAPFALEARRDGIWTAEGKKDIRPVPICAVCIAHLNGGSDGQSGARFPLRSSYDEMGQQLVATFGAADVQRIAVMRIALIRARSATDKPTGPRAPRNATQAAPATRLEAFARGLSSDVLQQKVATGDRMALVAGVAGMAIVQGLGLLDTLRSVPQLSSYLGRTNVDLIIFEGTASVLGGIRTATRPSEVWEEWPEGSAEERQQQHAVQAVIGAGYLFEEYASVQNAARFLQGRSGGTGLDLDHDPAYLARRLAASLVRGEGVSAPAPYSNTDEKTLTTGVGPVMMRIATAFVATQRRAFVQRIVPLLARDCGN